jgi:hypothetical protein
MKLNLSSQNFKEFNEVVAGFIESARKVKASGNGNRARKTSSTRLPSVSATCD